MKRLLVNIRKRNYRIGTGFLSTPLILPLLTKLGHSGTAYKMLENEEEPGWLYEVKQDATTVWENWDGSASQNHYSPGSVCEWLFETVCGIHVDGENHFFVAPIPGGTLTWASCSYQSIYGKIKSAWKIMNEKIMFNIVIPDNCAATVKIKNETKELQAGDYTLEYPCHGNADQSSLVLEQL